MRNAALICLLLILAGCAQQSPPARYVDSKMCRGCHEPIWRTYSRTGMARSLYRPAPGGMVERWGQTFFHAPSKRYYVMERRGDRFFQRRYEKDTRGREVNSFELEVHYVIGSGNHARSYFHRSPTGELTELPVTWYTPENRWAMSPGYDRAKHADFSRQADESCLFCHNAYPLGNDLPEGIDCQRCHGPGSRHIELSGKGGIVKNGGMDVCMQCHLETTSAELPHALIRFDRAVLSYRAGEPLSDYVVHFDHPAGAGHDDKFEIVNQAYRLRKSACFLKSEGRMTCTTCHDPHRQTDVAAVSAKCAGCHAGAHAGEQKPDCTGCHMPKRRTEDAVHVVMTDHLIQRQVPSKTPRNALAPLQEKAEAYRGPLALYYPATLPERERDLYLGVAHIANGADRRRGMAMLERVIDSAPPKAVAVLAEAYLTEGNTQVAIAMFRRAVAADPGLQKAHYNLGQALERTGAADAARAEYERALPLPEAQFGLHRYHDAIRARPTYAEAYNNLALAAAAEKRVDDAIGFARQAVAINLDEPQFRYNLGRLLDDKGDAAAALVEYRRALELNPDFVPAHLALGQALGNAGQLAAAVREFREVLRLQPDHAEARRNLQLALELNR